MCYPVHGLARLTPLLLTLALLFLTSLTFAVAIGDQVKVTTRNRAGVPLHADQTKLRLRMLGIDAPETPKGTKFPGRPYGKEAEASLKRMVEGKRVRVEIYGIDRYKRLLATMFIDE